MSTLYCADPKVVEAAGLEPPEAGFMPRVCCDSCHDDINEGYGDYAEVDLPGGDVAFVCCRIAERIKDQATKA